MRSGDRYSVRNIPTMIFFKDGKEVGRQVGAIAKSVLEEKLRAVQNYRKFSKVR
nr:thioredoxin family protein [uncultured Alistipes sp.]